MSQFASQIDAVHNRYRSRFAGFPRITRDAETLEQIIADATKLTSEALDADETELLGKNIELYNAELKGVKEAQGQGPTALLVHRLSTWANYVQARYARKFAGEARRTRDLGMLSEMIEDAGRVLSDMEALAAKNSTPNLTSAIEVTQNNLKSYRMERDRIREDRKKVFGAERGTLFARLANDQFQRYRTHFANKSRLSRNVRTLEFIVEGLQEILDGMEALFDDGFKTETHKKNIGLVKNNLSVYATEVQNIKDAKAGASLEQRVGEFGGAANEIFATYRENFAGKSRETRDLDLLHTQIELLMDIAKGMDALDREHDDDANARNLDLVMDMLHLYHREYNLVAEVKKG